MDDNKMQMTIPLKSGDLVLKNPVLTASGTFGYGVEFSRYGDLTGLGGIVTKGLSLKPMKGNPQPRIVETAAGMLNAIGLQNWGVEGFLENYLPKLPLEQLPVIVNIYAHSPEDFSSLAARLSNVPGIAALEVNISCPNVACGGLLFGQDPKMAFEVTRAVKQASGNLPVMVKLSPNVTSITEIALACEEGGADMLSCINTLTGMAVDLKGRRPALANVVGGLSGPAIKPVALRCVWQVANAVKIPVIGIGGVYCADDILEFLLVGAYAVQVGTANFHRPNKAFELPAELEARMKKLKIENLQSFRGTLQIPDIKSWDEM
ncbi:MAG: dihydroorotate dehydrogenase [Deltaproteobacteria bacterium]|jgi:dihydroorotate dehydrogenase (NAD+) catalytic subunit|nr:dihydroorotate dehydrogenase [Deltaproteobacteria bacterium]